MPRVSFFRPNEPRLMREREGPHDLGVHDGREPFENRLRVLG